MASTHSSHLRLAGRVEFVLRTPDAADLLLVVQDINSAAAAGGEASRGGVTFAKNLILLLLKGDWALSCAFVCPGDEIDIARFDVERTQSKPPLGGEGLRIALPGYVNSNAGVSPTAGSSTSNAPDLVSYASSQCNTTLPSTTLCITPSSASELVVLRKKRVVINFANVGNLELIDVTDKEKRDMRADHFHHNGGAAGAPLGPPPHHSAPKYGSATSQPSRGRATSPLRIAARGQQPSPTRQRPPLGSVGAVAGKGGIAGKNCYASMDKYYDVLFGQSIRMNPRVAFVERLIGLKSKILDVGSGSGLYAFMLRALGTTNVTCLEKSLTMLQMLEEKNRFFELVEGDVPDHQKKGRLRVIPGDASTFRLPIVDRSSGEEGFEDFTTVLCIAALSLLPSLQAVKDALYSISLHTRVGGQLIVSIPNSDCILRQGNYQAHQCFVVDRAGATLCAGATSAMPNGHVDTVVQTMIRLPHQGASADGLSVQPFARTGAALAAQDGVPRREVRYHGTAFHPGSTTEEGMFVSFQDVTEELLLPTALFEDAVLSVGFEMEGLFGNMCGAPFSPLESEERVYVFRRCEDQFDIAD